MDGEKPVCMKCIYFYTTWNPAMPYGCKAMGLQSARPPSELVRQSTGADCVAYRPKGSGEAGKSRS